MDHKATDHDRASALAESLDFIAEADLCALAGITPTTAEAWRKRHRGPAYVLLGRNYYYSRQAVAEYLHSLVRERRLAPAAKGLL